MIVDGKVSSKSSAPSEADTEREPVVREESQVTMDNESVVSDIPDAARSAPPAAAPPSYDSIGAPVVVDPTSHLPRSSHIATFNQNGSVKLSHILDLAHQVPIGALPPLEKGETEATRPNGKFASQNGSVNLQLGVAHSGLTGERPKGVRVRIKARSSNGSVTVKIFQRTQTLPFSLTAHSQNGSVTVFLPRDYHGPIRMKTGNGSFYLSSEVSAKAVTINGSKKDGLIFIGDMTNWQGKSSVEDPEEHVVGDGLDESILSTQNGSVKLRFFEDKEDLSVSGFISDIKAASSSSDSKCLIM